MRKKIIVSLSIVILAIAWYAFRPERLFVNQIVSEAQAAVVGGPLAAGEFHKVIHETSGSAAVYQTKDGNRILRFTNFKTSNGPDVHVYLVAADDLKDSASVRKSEFIDLGSIKGNIGDQNYTIGSGVDLSKFRSVSVWCKRFRANFGTAPLASGGLLSQK